ncbi:MAG: hypothetical protein BWY09_00160 [Candidatus Hydrogenedentes bacterium ADurb.Bin179]|nr:MAG: hypothetical protein BWY09_00160 [Candidatus Hydrogenedentes bacterium ADurb.Bin179]
MNSSMLNFNGWRKAFSLPARYHLWHGALAIAGLLVLLGCSGFLAYLNPKAAMPQAKWSKNTDAEILFLGNSQQRSLDVKQFCLPALNISVGGSDYSTHFAILRNLKRHLPRLRVVVVGFDTLLLRTDAIKGREGDYEELAAWGVPWWDIPNISWRERFLYFLSHNRLLRPVLCGPKLDQPELEKRITWQELFDGLSGPKTASAQTKDADLPSASPKAGETPPRSDVHKIVPPYTVAPADGENKMRHYIRVFNEYSHFETNRIAFLDMLRYCREKDLRMVLLRTPTTKAFWSNRPEDWDQELEALYEEGKSVYGTALPLWDEERSYTYEDDQFEDPNHLIKWYIHRILTPRINERLVELFNTLPEK